MATDIPPAITPNTETVYALTWLGLKDGLVVVESPPNVEERVAFAKDHLSAP